MIQKFALVYSLNIIYVCID